MIEKLIARSLNLKAEEQNKRNKQHKKEPAAKEHELTQIKYSQFLNFFKVLNERDSDAFIKAVNKQCEVKAVIKNDKVVQDTATIRLVEKPYADLKKLILKERPILRTAVKVIDTKQDKNVRKELKASLKAMQSTLSPEASSLLSALMQML